MFLFYLKQNFFNSVLISDLLLIMSEKKRLNRTKNSIYLIGSTCEQINASSLPNNQDVLSRIIHLLRFEKKSLKVSCSKTANEVSFAWKNAEIPTICESSIVRKVNKLYTRYANLDKNKNNKLSEKAAHKDKENLLRKDFALLFNISNDSKNISMEAKTFLDDQKTERILNMKVNNNLIKRKSEDYKGLIIFILNVIY